MFPFEGAPARRQPPPGTASMSHQYPRAMPPGPQQSGHQEFDPGLLFQLLQAPSFAPAADEMNQNKRKHDQLQVGNIAVLHKGHDMLQYKLVHLTELSLLCYLTCGRQYG